MKKYIFPAVMALILMLTAACSVTPESTVEEALTPAVTSIPSPVISTITSVNDETNPSITVTWDPVDNASFYVFEYQSAVDYLSGESEFISYVTSSNTFTIPSSAFTNSSDMRFIFKVKSAYKPSSSRSIIYSSDSEIKEAVVINTFSISPIIQDNVLTIYSTFPKIKSVLTGENIIQPVIKYYSVGDDNTATELESNTLTLASAEKKTIRADLIVDDKVVATKEVSVTNSADYYPPQLKSLKSTTNEKGKIILTWVANPINAGLESYSATMRFYIERKESTAERWSTLMDDDGEVYYIEGAEDGGEFTYSDTTPEEGKDYLYRVITQYVLTDNDTTILYDEKKEKTLLSDISYIQDTKVKSFIIKEGTGFDGEPATGDATYQIRMNWETYHSLPEGMELVVSRSEFNFNDSINGNANSQKYEEVYRGRDIGVINYFTLTANENKSVHNYTYYIQIAPINSSSDNPRVQAKKEDENGNLVDGIIKTNPSIKEVSFISTLSATNNNTALCDRVELEWTYNESAIKEAGLDVSKVNVHILKKTSTDASYTDITENNAISGKSYTDTDVVPDNTYYYILIPYYNDESSPYSGAQSAETDKTATGEVLGLVKEISATINKSNTSIDVSWTAVDNANGYVVYYREEGSTDWTKGPETARGATTCTLSSSLKAGKRYEITVSAVDSNKNAKPSDSVIAEGEILGPVQNLKATGDDNIQSGSIIVTWDAVENADLYEVKIFDSSNSNESIYSVKLRASEGTSYTLDATGEIITAYSLAHNYSLSQKYYFTVTPIIGNMTPTAEPTKVEGYWVMPPKNITATKIAYRDLVILSWEKVPSAKGYRIYRREYNTNNDWTFVAYSTETTASFGFDGTEKNAVYEYTVSTVIGSQEGNIQQYFENDSSYPGYKKNVGCPLVNPTDVYGTICANNVIKISFTVPEFVNSFKITPNGRDTQTFSLTSSSSKNVGEVGYYSYEDGVFTCYVTKPLIELNPELQINIKSYNADAPLSTNNTSFGYSLNIVPTKDAVNSYEVVNLANNILKSALSEVNTAYNSDWWIPYDTQPYSSQDGTIYAEGCGTKLLGGMETVAFVRLTEYYGKGAQISLSGEIGVHPDTSYGIDPGYRGIDPPQYIEASPNNEKTITVNLPYTLGTATITYNDVYLDGSKGSYTVTFNGKTETIDFSKVSVRPY